MKKRFLSIITTLVLIAFGCVPGEPVPDEIIKAISTVATSNGFQPREPHYLLEQFIPAATGSKEQRSQIASILLEAIKSEETTPAGRTVIAQHLAKVAGEAEYKALRKMLGNPQTEADIKIALGETENFSIKKESLEFYKAEIKSNDPAKQIAGISAISYYYPEAVSQLSLNMINSDNNAVNATAIRLLTELDPATPVIVANKDGMKKVLLVTGLEYPGHPWQITAPALTNFLAQDKRLEVSYIEDPNYLSKKELDSYDVILLNYQNHQIPAPEGALTNLKQVIKGGKGLVLVHFACGAFIDWETKAINTEFAEIAGRVWNPELRGHDPRGPFQVHITDNNHPITKGLSDFNTDDELYTCLDGTVPIHILANAKSKVDQKDYPMAFVLTPGKGRTFHCLLGHDLNALNEAVGELYRRGTLWAAGLEIDQ
jgi:uncharacterized protein